MLIKRLLGKFKHLITVLKINGTSVDKNIISYILSHLHLRSSLDVHDSILFDAGDSDPTAEQYNRHSYIIEIYVCTNLSSARSTITIIIGISVRFKRRLLCNPPTMTLAAHFVFCLFDICDACVSLFRRLSGDAFHSIHYYLAMILVGSIFL